MWDSLYSIIQSLDPAASLWQACSAIEKRHSVARIALSRANAIIILFTDLGLVCGREIGEEAISFRLV